MKTTKEKEMVKLPKKCECGGKLVYEHAFGRIFCHCAKCTPVVKVKPPKTPGMFPACPLN